MRIAVGSDDAGATLRPPVIELLAALGHEVSDVGCDDPSVLYPDVAHTVATAVRRGEYERAVLLCGTGIGMSIVANKVPGVYAALCHDTYSAERARKSNNAQILTMGARVIGVEVARSIVLAWASSEFDAARSGRKVAAIARLETGDAS